MSAYRDPTNGRFIARDGLVNLVSGAGTSADKRTWGFYTRPFILPEQIEAAYRSSWMMKKGINLPPKDMTRKKRVWQADEGEVDLIEKEEKRLGLWPKLRQGLILGRLGGGLMIMGVGREDPELPLGDATRAKGSLRYLHVMNRWQVTLGQMVMDPEDDLFGQPAYFQINYGAGGIGQLKIHPSRCVAFKGEPSPNLYGARADEWFWGDPLVVSVQDAVKNAEAAMNGFASLIEEAKIDTVTIPGLTQMLATKEGEDLILKRITVANEMKSTHNTRILDGGRSKDSPGEEWDTRQVTWTGMPDMIRVKAAIVASAFDIPATRFLGKSADGMNATGEGDEANYDAKIDSDQDDVLRPALDQIDAVLLPSAGVTITAEASYSFPPRKEMSALDKATIFDKRMDGLTKLQGTGTIPEPAFSKAVQHTAVEEMWLEGLDGALEETPEGERFPSAVAEAASGTATDPNAATPTARAVNDARFLDAAPKSLYIERKLLNADEVIRWAKAQGLDTTLAVEDMHVTIAFSRIPVDWFAIGSDWGGDENGKLRVKPGGPRAVERLGDGDAVALLFSDDSLEWRHKRIIEAGASWDWPEYRPHITLSWQAPGVDVATIKPYAGPLVFGPELFSEVKEDWKAGVTES